MRLKATSTWLVRVGLPALLASAVVSGQSQTGSQSPQQPTFRSTTDYVTTDVRVRGEDGQFVPTLGVSDFKIFEDGVEQTITHFQLAVGGRIVSDMTPAPLPVSEGLILPAARPRTDVSGRIFIVFIDDMHVQPADTPRLRNVLKDIRDELVHENDLVGIVSTGFSSIAVDLTYDVNHRRLNEAIDKVMGSADTPADILDMPESTEGVARLRYNANVAFRTAYDILDQAEKVRDRRKSFIYVSSGYAFNPFRDARYDQAKEWYEWNTLAPEEDTNDPNTAGRSTSYANERRSFTNPFDDAAEFSELQLIAQIAELARRARRANVVFYTLDPRGLQAGPAINYELTINDWRDWVTDTISTLQILANETGGFAIVNTNDVRPGLRRIDAETSDYYIIGYSSTNPDPLRVRRQVEITVPERPDLELQYQNSYTLDRNR